MTDELPGVRDHYWVPFLSMNERLVADGPIETMGLVKVCRVCGEQRSL